MKIYSKRHKQFKPKFDKIILPAIHRYVPGTIASELVKVQPMSKPEGLIFTTGTFDWSLAKLPKQKTILKSKRHPDRVKKTIDWDSILTTTQAGFISRRYLMELADFTENEIEDAVASMNEDFDTLGDLRVPESLHADSVQYQTSTTLPYQHL